MVVEPPTQLTSILKAFQWDWCSFQPCEAYGYHTLIIFLFLILMSCSGGILLSSPATLASPEPCSSFAVLFVALHDPRYQGVHLCMYSMCGKSSRQPPTGLLSPLSIFSGRTLQLVLSLLFSCLRRIPQSSQWWIDFWKAVYFMPCPELPSARENVDLLVRHGFRLHGFPGEPLWRDSCGVLGASVSGEGKPDFGEHPPMCDSSTSSVLEFLPALAWICPQLFGRGHHWYLSHYGLKEEVAVPSVQAHLQGCVEMGPLCPPALFFTVSEAGQLSPHLMC